MRPNSLLSTAALVFALGVPTLSAAQDKPFGFTNLVPPLPDQTDVLTVFVSVKGTPPPLDELQKKDNWRLAIVSKEGSRIVPLDDVKWEAEPNTEMVSLIFRRANTFGVDLSKAGWRAVFLGGQILTASADAPSDARFKAAKGKDDASIYAFGSLLVGPSTKPLYVIDLKFDLTHEMTRGWFRGWLRGIGATASTNTDAKPPVDEVEVDADAISALLSFTKRVRVGSSWLYGRKWTITPFQGDFTRKTFVATGLTAGQLQLNLRPIANSVTVYPQFGYEFGHTIRKPGKIDEQPVNLDEWNWIVRAYTGAAAQWTLFKANATADDWYYVTLGANYTARFPFRPEPFVESEIKDGARVSVTTLGKGTRHEAEAEFNWNVHKYTSVSLKYKYGAEAPLFKLVDHQWTVGITVKAAQK